MGSPSGAHSARKTGFGVRRYRSQFTKFGNHFDGALDVKFLDRALLQIMRNGRDAVGLLDRKFGDRQKTSVVSDQGNVGAVQRGDERQRLRRRHHARQQGADGMGNRVMHVQQIEAFRLGHLHHFYGQGKRVRRMIEQRITRNFHFMELNSLVGVRQPDGRSIADEVDFVAARGKFHPQFRGDHARAAVRWVTCDPNLHLDPGKMPIGSSKWRFVACMNSRAAKFQSGGSLTNTVSNETENLLRPIPPEC